MWLFLLGTRLVEDEHEDETNTIKELYATRPWQFLYFLPLPHGQGSFLPTVAVFCR